MVFYGLNGELSKHTASPVTLPRAVPGGSPPCTGTVGKLLSSLRSL